MLTFVANGLVIAGFLILIAALFSVRKLISQLPRGEVRRRWLFQSGLIVLFILSYLAYAILFWNHNTSPSDLIVPSVFFFGAGFVWVTISLSSQTAMAVRRVTILEQEIITDSLLGIYNRRYLERRLKEEFDRARRYQQDVALLLIDIDHFKRVNDTFGHQVGDQVLRSFAHIIQNIVRGPDIVARFGGDEILVIAPCTTTEAAFALAERICKIVETHDFTEGSEPGSHSGVHITVSIGVTGLTAAMDSVEMFLKDADRELYFAKSRGRNRAASGTVKKLEKSIES